MNVVSLYVAESPQAHTHTLNVASMYLFCLQIPGYMFLYYFGLMSIFTYWLSQITSIRSWVLLPVLRTQFFFSAQIQGVQGKTAYWGKGKWRTDT